MEYNTCVGDGGQCSTNVWAVELGADWFRGLLQQMATLMMGCAEVKKEDGPRSAIKRLLQVRLLSLHTFCKGRRAHATSNGRYSGGPTRCRLTPLVATPSLMRAG